MSQRFSGRARRRGDYYPTPRWVTRTLLPHVPVFVEHVWEPAAGDGRMADVLRKHGFEVTATDIDEGDDFFDCSIPCDLIASNPPYGLGGRLAEKFIERALRLTRKRRGVVAMLLKVDFDSGSTRRRFFADCPAWSRKIVLLRRIQWFKSETGNSSSENHAWYIWNWRHKGSARIAYAPRIARPAKSA
jgi:hypothetical protein